MTLLIAHRGASAQQPENTIAAFRAARALGARWVELDVRCTLDGELAVHHDEMLADGSPVASVRAASLPPDVPLLAAALDACEGMGVNVEVKPQERADVVELVVAEVRAWGGEVLVSSFDHALADRVRAMAPEVPTALLVAGGPFEAATSAAAAGHAALNPWDGLVDERLVGHCHDLGLEVNVWTVDSPERIRQLAAMGVDGIVTNVIDIARAALALQPGTTRRRAPGS